jgi:hypothetical protein
VLSKSIWELSFNNRLFSLSISWSRFSIDTTSNYFSMCNIPSLISLTVSSELNNESNVNLWIMYLPVIYIGWKFDKYLLIDCSRNFLAPILVKLMNPFISPTDYLSRYRFICQVVLFSAYHQSVLDDRYFPFLRQISKREITHLQLRSGIWFLLFIWWNTHYRRPILQRTVRSLIRWFPQYMKVLHRALCTSWCVS